MKKYLTINFAFFITLVLHGQLIHVKNLPQGGINFVGTNNLLFFTNSAGTALWKSDGTSAGTFIIKSGLTSVGNLIVVEDRVYFEDRQGNSVRIWVSDGTSAGTKVLSTHDGIYSMQALGNRLVYIVFTNPGYELWTSNGTIAGTTFLASVAFHASISKFGNKIAFVKETSQGAELWISDGTRSGTHIVKDINPGAGSGLGWTTEFKEFNGLLFFAANDGSRGNELWKTDGTESGTQLVKDLNPGSAGSQPHSYVIVNNKLFFLAETPENGLWKTDGTSNGTELIKAFNYQFRMFRSIVINGILYFADLGDNTFIGLYRSDGTAQGTYVLEASDNATVFNLFNVNGTLAYITHLDNMWYLFKNNGSPGGSTLITSGISDHQNAVIGNLLYYTRTYYTDEEIGGTDKPTLHLPEPGC